MNLKIGILGSRGVPNAYGGFEECAQHLSEGLAKKGHKVFVYNSSLHPYKEKTWRGANIIHCKDYENKLGATGQFIYDFNCFIDARKRNYDVLLQLGYTSSSIWHWLWPRDAINVVNMDGLEWKRTQYSKPVREFIKKAEALAAKHADYMVADSAGIQQYISERYQKRSGFIPYGAQVFKKPDASMLNEIKLKPFEYYLVVARLEPENNIEMIIAGFLNSKKDHDLVIVGKENKYGNKWKQKYADEKIKFIGAVYDKQLLNNLRYFSKLHFHGHSVGGTNPSLLEAMACQSNIAAHNNIFNQFILENDAEYFSNSEQVSSILNSENYQLESPVRKEKNLKKIVELYNWQKIVDAYEALMMEAIHTKAKPVLPFATHQIV
jgi:glycosyltransferase involved in cell wall biosynthesis